MRPFKGTYRLAKRLMMKWQKAMMNALATASIHNIQPQAFLLARHSNWPQPTVAYIAHRKAAEKAKQTDYEMKPSAEFDETGIASWYGRDFDGRPTANGEIFDSRKLSAAHKGIPLGSVILVRNLENGKEVFLRVNDRGPFVPGRILDLSEYGAEVLDFKEKGLTKVSLRVMHAAKELVKKEGRGATAGFFEEQSEGGDLSIGNDLSEWRNDGVNKVTVGDGTKNSHSSGNENYYSIQVGSFTQFDNARRLKKYLGYYEVPVRIVENDGHYLVHMGSFSARQDAESLKQELNEEGYTSFIRSLRR